MSTKTTLAPDSANINEIFSPIPPPAPINIRIKFSIHLLKKTQFNFKFQTYLKITLLILS